MAQVMRQKPTKQCDRCGLQFTEDKDECPHCTGLSENELDELKRKIEEHHQSNSNIGKLFLYFAVIVLVILVIVAL